MINLLINLFKFQIKTNIIQKFIFINQSQSLIVPSQPQVANLEGSIGCQATLIQTPS
jgi:hypothetical protein